MLSLFILQLVLSGAISEGSPELKVPSQVSLGLLSSNDGSPVSSSPAGSSVSSSRAGSPVPSTRAASPGLLVLGGFDGSRELSSVETVGWSSSTGPPDLPVELSWHGAAVLKQTLLVCGGYKCCRGEDEEPVISNTCWMWTPGSSGASKSGTWSSEPSLPEASEESGASETSGQIKDSGTWSPGPSLQEPLAAGGLVNAGGYLLWLGGHPKITVNPTNKTWVLDSLDAEWRDGPRMKIERAWHCSTAFEEGAVVVGGRDRTYTLTNTAELVTKDGVNSLGVLHNARVGHGCAAVGKKLYVVGGIGVEDKALRSVEVLEAGQNGGMVWRVVGDTAEPRFSITGAMVAVEGSLYILGGEVHLGNGSEFSRSLVSSADGGVTWQNKGDVIQVSREGHVVISQLALSSAGGCNIWTISLFISGISFILLI